MVSIPVSLGNIYLDYVSDLGKRISLTGHVFTLLECANSWKATLQLTVVLSSIEVEYLVVVEAMKEAIRLIGLATDLSLKQDETIVFYDSQNTIHLIKNQMYHEKTKNINVRYHFLQEIVKQGDITINKIVVDRKSNAYVD
jgi:hypothetical protein